MYIQRFCSISPAGVITPEDALSSLQHAQGATAPCIEPDYKNLILPMQLRRMTKPVRTGVAAAKLCLNHTGVDQPASIHVGTAYGMLQDSENFLQKMIVQEEQMLNPTAFIQSTHNTVAGQIALSMGCMAHNMTFVHKAHSFEGALLDATLMPDTGHAVLVGAVDETTDTSYAILERFGVYHKDNTAGEGASFFLLSHHKNESSLVKIAAFDMFTAASDADAQQQFRAFCDRHQLAVSKNDIFLNGLSNTLASLPEIFAGNKTIPYKAYCGEFPTAAAFALALATMQITENDAGRCWILTGQGRHYGVYVVDQA